MENNSLENPHAFQDVTLEAPSSPPPSPKDVVHEAEEMEQDRGERVKHEIAMLSPMQRSSGNETGLSNDNSMALDHSNKSRPEDLNIKSFVPSKPLPVPTPSRESTLTQKLELALGKKNCVFTYLTSVEIIKKVLANQFICQHIILLCRFSVSPFKGDNG